MEEHRLDDARELVETHFSHYLLENPTLLHRAFEAAASGAASGETPRWTMLRTIAQATGHPAALIDPQAQEAFRQWVESLPAPDAADVLILHRTTLRRHIARGANDRASALADEILTTLHAVPHPSARVDDLAPGVLLRCGVAKLLNGERSAAMSCFAAARQWSRGTASDLQARYADEHLALVHVLDQRYGHAAALLTAPPPAGEPGTWGSWLDAAGFLARLLLAINRLDVTEARRLDRLITPEIEHGELGWVVWFAHAALAILDGDVWPTLLRIDTELLVHARPYDAGSLAGSYLRVALVALHQSTGDLQTAQGILSDPALDGRNHAVLLALARQEILCNRPDRALAVLARRLRTDDTRTLRDMPTGAVLGATAELMAFGRLAPATVAAAAAALRYHHAETALSQATPPVRAQIQHQLRLDDPILQIFAYASPTALTSAERRVLEALRQLPTIREVATALHLSPDTVKTHTKSLYRKLGARTRDDALRLATDVGRSSPRVDSR